MNPLPRQHLKDLLKYGTGSPDPKIMAEAIVVLWESLEAIAQHMTANRSSLTINAKTLDVGGADQVTIRSGGGTIQIKKDGTITIKGKDISIQGSGKVDVKSSKDMVMKGAKILQN